MADTKITALAAIATVDPAADVLPIVDISDTSMAASGTTKKVTSNQILGAGGTATLASATITGDLTAARLIVTGGTIPANGLWLPTTNTLEFAANSLAQYRIAPLGVFSWYDGAGGTRMTLNSSGLGIGGTPTEKLSVNGSIGFQNAATQRWHITATSGSDLVFTRSGGADRFTMTSDGNLGIGVVPSAWTSYKALQINTISSLSASTGSTDLALNWRFDSSNKYIANGFASSYTQYNGTHVFNIAGNNTLGAGAALTWTPAMTLDASGNLLVGTTVAGMTAGGLSQRNFNGNCGQILFSNNSGAAEYVARFYYGSTPTNVGNITVASSGTTYDTISDYRLKESVKPISGGLTRVNALKPSVYNWKADGSAGEGFLAHELAEVVPFAVIGEKDAVNEDGTIKSQGIDMSRIVPILVAAIQELTAEVNALKNA